MFAHHVALATAQSMQTVFYVMAAVMAVTFVVSFLLYEVLKLIRGTRAMQMALDEALQPERRIEPGPFGTQHGDRIALLANFRAQLQHAFGARGRVHLDPIDIGRCEHQCADHEEVDEPHRQPPRITSERRGQDGRSSAWCAGASVRSAARSFAERARGLAASSGSPGGAAFP